MTDLMSLYTEILRAAQSDADLSKRCHTAEEYARLHLYARKVNGCNSLGEIENLLDEFRRMVNDIIRYCGKKHYIDELAIFSIDLTDRELTNLGSEIGEFL